jgi:hypothetical protein
MTTILLRAFFVLFLASPVFASITLKTQVELGNGSKASPRLTLKRGEWVAVGEDDILLKVVTAKEPKELGSPVLVEAEIYSSKEGGTQLVGHASLRIKCGKESRVVVTEPDGSLRYSFSASPLKEGECG